jgi:hypothetical protein
VPLKGKPDELLESLLDIGEAAVISLAREQNANLVLIANCAKSFVTRKGV